MIHFFVLFVVVIGFIGLICDHQRITYDIIMFEGAPLEVQLRNNHLDLNALSPSNRTAIEKAWKLHHRILHDEWRKAMIEKKRQKQLDDLKIVQDSACQG